MAILSKINPKVIPKIGGKTAVGSGGVSDIYQTLGTILNANLDTEYVSRKVSPEGFTGVITVTSGNGQVSKNGSVNWDVAVSMVEGDYYQARATSSTEFETSIVVTVDLPDSFTITTRQLDISPNPFTFIDQEDVEPSTLTTSLPVVITGMDPACPVSVVGGEYDINQSGSWTAAAGTIDSGDEVRARRTSGDFDSTVGVEFTAGTRSDIFNIASRAKDETPNPFPFTDVTDATANTLVTSDPVTVTGMDDGCPTSVVDGEYDINQSGVWLTGTSSINEDDQIRLRRYSGGDPVLNPDGSVMIDPDGQPVSTSIVSATMTVGTVSEVFTISVDEQPGTGLPIEDLIGSYDGVMSDAGDKLLAVENRGNESQLLPTVIAGDGAGYVPAGVLDITGYTQISVACRLDNSAPITDTGALVWIKHSGTDGIKVLLNVSSQAIGVRMDDGGDDICVGAENSNQAANSIILTHDGTTLRGYMDGVEFDSTPSNFHYSGADGTVTLGGRDDGAVLIDGNTIIWDADIFSKGLSAAEALAWHNGTLDDASLVMSFVPGEAGSDTVWDTVTGLSYEGTNFSGAAIVEKTDGSGSSFINENGCTIADGSTMYTTSAASVLVPEGTIVPAGCGFTSGGQPYPTEYPGPLAADMEVRNMSCIAGDGAGYVSAGTLDITGYTAISVALRFSREAFNIGTTEVIAWITHSGGDGIKILFDISERINVGVDDGTAYSVWDDVNKDFSGLCSVVLTFSGTTLEGVLNGTSFGTLPATFDFSTASGLVTLLGRDTGDLQVSGGIYWDVCIYDKALSSAEAESWHEETLVDSSLVARYPCQDQLPGETSGTLVLDVVGGNDGTLTGFTGTAWGIRDEGENYLAKGYNIDSGFIYADPDNAGYDIDSNPLEYLEGAWDTFQNMGVDVLGPFAAEAQALIEFTAGQEFDFGGAPFNTSDYIFNGTTGGAIYSEAQDQSVIDEIIDVIGDGT